MQPHVLESNSQHWPMLGATKLEALRNFCNINITFKEMTLQDPSHDKRLKLKKKWQHGYDCWKPFLPLSHSVVSTTAQGFPIQLCQSLESSRCILSTLERCLVTVSSLCSWRRNISPEGHSGHMRPSPTLKGAENNLYPNIWAAVKCLRLSDRVFNNLSPCLITLNTVMKR